MVGFYVKRRNVGTRKVVFMDFFLIEITLPLFELFEMVKFGDVFLGLKSFAHKFALLFILMCKPFRFILVKLERTNRS